MHCPVCSSSYTRTIKAYACINDFFKGKEVRECVDCCMQYIHPMPNEKEWDEYNSSYFQNAHDGLITSPWIWAYNCGVAKIRFHWLLEHLKFAQINVRSILEIGPGQGFLMREWLAKHPDTEYYVVESDSTTHKELSSTGGVIISPDQIQTIGSVDLVIATHVIEHTLKPVDFMKYYCSILRPDGGVFIEAPCRDHLYKNIYEPHVQFFEKNSLSACFDSAGLTKHNITYSGDRIKAVRRNALIRKILVKLQRRTRLPFNIFLGSYWPNRSKYKLSASEALAIVETSPHIHQDEQARWIRGFAQKVKT